jgi:hypothetical protein
MSISELSLRNSFCFVALPQDRLIIGLLPR